jgi:hypothetical protein
VVLVTPYRAQTRQVAHSVQTDGRRWETQRRTDAKAERWFAGRSLAWEKHAPPPPPPPPPSTPLGLASTRRLFSAARAGQAAARFHPPPIALPLPGTEEAQLSSQKQLRTFQVEEI